MVEAFGARCIAALRSDFGGLLSCLTHNGQALLPGLYTYQRALDRGSRRVHLRVDRSGNAVLFIDVTDVIHLNPTAAYITKLALDGMNKLDARKIILRQFNRVDKPSLDTALAQLYEMVNRLKDRELGCPTCALDIFSTKPLFSTEVLAPFKADLALTYGCNNECPHCYNETERFNMPSLCVQDWRKALDKLVDIGIPHIIFTGGEATLHPHLLELIGYADSLGCIVGLNTNGRRISNKSYMDDLVQAGLNHIQITLGSSVPDVHDAMMGAKSFEQTIKGIENALGSSVHVITNTTLMRSNIDDIEGMLDFLFMLGIRTFAMNGMIYSGGGFTNGEALSDKELPSVLLRIRDHARQRGMRFLWYTPTEYCAMNPVELEIGAKRCNAGEYSICVEPNGDILPCQSYYVSAGNILRDPWERIWESSLFKSFRDRERDPSAYGLPEKCWECPDLPLCGGGCRIEREARQGVRVACSTGCSSSKKQSGFVPHQGLVRIRGRAGGRSLLPIISKSA